MSVVELLVAAVVIAVGAAVQSGVGFGMNIMAAPLLVLIDPDFVPGPAVAAAFLLTILVAARERASIDGRSVAPALVGRVPGTILGAMLVSSIPERGISLAVGAGVLVAVVLSVTRLRLRPTRSTLLVAGAVSGFAGTISSIGGPPMAVVYANEPGPVVRASLAVIFLVGGVMSLIALAVVGDFGSKEAGLTLLLTGPAVIGFLCSRRLTAHLDAGRTRAAVLSLSLFATVAIIGKELL